MVLGRFRQADAVPTVTLPAPVALARLTDTLTPVGAANLVWQPKWDGYLH